MKKLIVHMYHLIYEILHFNKLENLLSFYENDILMQEII